MQNHSYHSLKGDIFVRKAGSADAFRFIGNVAAGAFAMTRETIKLTSSGIDAGTLAEEETSRDATLSLTLNSLQARNLAMVLYGSVVTQAAATGVSVSIPALAEGEAFPLPVVNVLKFELSGKTAGVDYRLHAKTGTIVALKALAAGTATVDHGAAEAVGVFTNTGDKYEVLYISETSGKRIRFLSWNPSPAKAVQLIASEFASLEIDGSLLKVEGADAVFGGFAKVETAV